MECSVSIESPDGWFHRELCVSAGTCFIHAHPGARHETNQLRIPAINWLLDPSYLFFFSGGSVAANLPRSCGPETLRETLAPLLSPKEQDEVLVM